MNNYHRIVYLSVIFYTFLNMNLVAQKSIDNSIIDDLYNEKIITTEGRVVLSELLTDYPVVESSSVLSMLSEIYGKEYLDRSNLYEIFKELSPNSNLSQKSIQKDSINSTELSVIVDDRLKDMNFKPSGLSSPYIQGLSIEGSNLVPISQSVFGRNIITLSSKFVKLGLIDESLREDFLSRIVDKTAPESMMISYFSFSMGEKEKQPEINLDIKKSFQEWKKVNIIDSSSIINFSEVSELIDILRYSSRAKIISLNTLPSNAFDGYQIIYDEIGKLMNESIALLEFNLTVVDESGSSTKRIDAKIVIDINGVQYLDTIHYNYAGGNTTIEDGLKTRFTTRLINIVNKALVQNNDCRRVYYINAGETGYSSNKIGVMLLNKDQYFTVKNAKNIYFIFGPHPEKLLSECMSKLIVDEAIQIGIIDKVPSNEAIQDAKSLVSAILISSKLKIPQLYKIKDLTNTMFLDYFSIVSNNETEFKNIQLFDLDENSQMIKFDFNNKPFEFKLSKEKKFDFDLYKHISKILSLDIDDSQFYNLGYNQYDIGTMYLNQEQKKWIKSNGMNIWIGKF